jgi:hypothetical protein
MRVPDLAAAGDIVRMDYPPRRTPREALVPQAAVLALERGDRVALRRFRLTPEQLEEVRRRAEENGLLGEKIVLDAERKRLTADGHADLADRVRWTSRESVAAGYDIYSFEADATERFVEVKATEGAGQVFEISGNEWTTAQQRRNRYVIARVTRVRHDSRIQWFRDPVSLVESGELTVRASGWIVTIVN